MNSLKEIRIEFSERLDFDLDLNNFAFKEELVKKIKSILDSKKIEDFDVLLSGEEQIVKLIINNDSL